MAEGVIIAFDVMAGSGPLDVITGLVPVIPMDWIAALFRIGTAGTGPALTWKTSFAAEVKPIRLTRR